MLLMFWVFKRIWIDVWNTGLMIFMILFKLLEKEVQNLRVKSHLECHANYQWICVTSKLDDSHCNWEKVQRHLQGIWHNSNTSLDITLHNKIMNLKNAVVLSFDAAVLLIKLFMAYGQYFHLGQASRMAYMAWSFWPFLSWNTFIPAHYDKTCL